MQKTALPLYRLTEKGNYVVPVLFLLLFTLSLTTVSVAAAMDVQSVLPQPQDKQISVEEPKTEPQKITTAHLIAYSTRLYKGLIDLQSQLDKITPPDDAREEITKTQQALDSLKSAIITERKDENWNWNYTQLSDTMARLTRQQDRLNNTLVRLNKAMDILSKQKEDWSNEQDTLKIWVTALKHTKSFVPLRKNITELQKTITNHLEIIQEKMQEILVILRENSSIQIKLYNLKMQIRTRMEELRIQGRQQTSPSIFNPAFYSLLDKNTLSMARQNAADALTKEIILIRDNAATFFLFLIFPLLLSIVFIKNKHFLKQHPNWSMLAERPIAFSFFSTLLFGLHWVNMNAANLLPSISIIGILSIMLLAGKLEKIDHWLSRFIFILSLYLILNIIIERINLPAPLQRLYLLIGSLGWLSYFIYRFFFFRKQMVYYHKILIIISVITIVGILAVAMSGYDELADYLFRGVFLTIFLLVTLIVLFQTAYILLELLFTLLPVVQRHTRVILRALYPMLYFFCALLFYAITAAIWHLYPTYREALLDLTSTTIAIGHYTLSMHTVFMIISIGYGTIMISRALRSMLMDEILPYYNIDKGVQLSIIRLIHYVILLIGFLILLQAIGVSLTKLTILGGALSVGIGFGLQTIVNNFASGLILLFERPVKVGDTIEVENQLGEVKHLGLRSTIIKTFDNAEIVIPNSYLIANQVTNWTLAERRARIKIPVGVAYGTDIATVLNILVTIAREHPMVMTTPAPKALFLSFGASSLDFELRVWIGDFSDRRTVQSELNQAINSEFDDAGIEIPFPQSDLHLRSIDEEVAEALYPPKVATET